MTMMLSYSITDQTIAFVKGDGIDIITDSKGRFLKGGFTGSNIYTVSGSDYNDGSYPVDSVSDYQLTLEAGDYLTSEDAGALVTIGNVEFIFSPRVNQGYAIPEHRERRQYVSPNGDLIINEIFAKKRWEIPINNVAKVDYDKVYTWWDNMLKLKFTPDITDLGTYYWVRIINTEFPLGMMGGTGWKNKYEGTLILREVPALS